MCFGIDFVVCGPNEAFVITGMFQGGGVSFITEGGRAFICKSIQSVQRISLETITLSVVTPMVLSNQAVPITVRGTAQVKLMGESPDMLETNACLYGSKDQEEILEICLETLGNHQRSIIGNCTIEEIYKDRERFSAQVYEVASMDLYNLGFRIVSYEMEEMTDEVGYVETLDKIKAKRDGLKGKPETQEDSAVAETEVQEQDTDAEELGKTLRRRLN